MYLSRYKNVYLMIPDNFFHTIFLGVWCSNLKKWYNIYLCMEKMSNFMLFACILCRFFEKKIFFCWNFSTELDFPIYVLFGAIFDGVGSWFWTLKGVDSWLKHWNPLKYQLKWIHLVPKESKNKTFPFSNLFH